MKRIIICLSVLLCIGAHAQFSVSDWYHNKSTTVIFTFDDWSPGQMYIAVPMMVEKDIDATFFVSLTNMWRDQEDFDMMIYGVNNGCEIGNHTDQHPTLTAIPEWQLDGEIDDVQDYLNLNVPNQNTLTFCYPRGAWNNTIRTKVMANHIGARGIQYPESGTWDYNFAQTEEDYYSTPTVTVNEDYSASEMGAEIRKGIAEGGMLTFMFHSIYSNTVNDYWWDEISEWHLEELSDTAVNYRDKVWITTYKEAIKYHKEANYAQINVQSNTVDEIVLDIADGLDGAIYDHDLTIDYVIPNGEIYTSVTQQGVELNYTIEDGVLTFDAQPDGTDIVITKETSVGMSELAMGFDNMNAYPMPVKNQMHVALQMSKATSGNLFITDLSGQRLLEIENGVSLNVGSNQLDVSLGGLSEGVYLLNIETTEGLVTRKIIKQ